MPVDLWGHCWTDEETGEGVLSSVLNTNKFPLSLLIGRQEQIKEQWLKSSLANE